MIREIVHIDEDLCDGCGLCIPTCHEGALKLVDGKARLVADRICDGLGACLGHCPRGAIRIERREADAFDEQAVAVHLETHSTNGNGKPATQPLPQTTHQHTPHGGGCPGSRLMSFGRPALRVVPSAPDQHNDTPAAESELSHWPVQLRLLPPHAPVLKGASLLVAADCVPVACGDFHSRLLRGRAVVIGCPKFDDLADYVERLTAMIQSATLSEIVVARMEVPCCTGLVAAVLEARRRAGVDVRVVEVVVGTRGEIRAETERPIEAVR